ncbi:hypothetical protein BDR04DRAFT_1201505 [Suillus decipiens]|nr:hypothetical protein BDR04DRAFT_1201505 [Suillus decipiens]
MFECNDVCSLVLWAEVRHSASRFGRTASAWQMAEVHWQNLAECHTAGDHSERYLDNFLTLYSHSNQLSPSIQSSCTCLLVEQKEKSRVTLHLPIACWSLFQCTRQMSQLELDAKDDDNGFWMHVKSIFNRQLHAINTDLHSLAFFLHPKCRKLAVTDASKRRPFGFMVKTALTVAKQW